MSTQIHWVTIRRVRVKYIFSLNFVRMYVIYIFIYIIFKDQLMADKLNNDLLTTSLINTSLSEELSENGGLLIDNSTILSVTDLPNAPIKSNTTDVSIENAHDVNSVDR